MSGPPHRILAHLLAPAAALGLAVAFASPASAERGESPTGSGERHCVVHLSDDNTVSCYDSFQTAIADATGGRVTDAPEDAGPAAASRDFRHRMREASTAAERSTDERRSSFVLSAEFTGPNQSGSTWLVEADSGCNDSGGVEWELGEIGDWENTISSFVGYSDCQVNHFVAPNYGGDSPGFDDAADDMGDFDDTASSMRWG